MRKEELVAIKIQQFLNSADQTDNPEYADLATQYAGMCRGVEFAVGTMCLLISRTVQVQNAI